MQLLQRTKIKQNFTYMFTRNQSQKHCCNVVVNWIKAHMQKMVIMSVEEIYAFVEQAAKKVCAIFSDDVNDVAYNYTVTCVHSLIPVPYTV